MVAKLPTVPKISVSDTQLQRQTDAVKTLTDTLTGKIGTGLQRAVLIQDLKDWGVVSITMNAAGNITNIVGGSGGGGGGGSNYYIEDNHTEEITPEVLEIPPAPTNLEAFPAFGSIMLTWDGPAYTEGTGGTYTEIWRYSANELANAILVGVSFGNLFTDVIPLKTGWYYWIRHVNTGYLGAEEIGAYQNVDGLYSETNDSVDNIINDIQDGLFDSDIINELRDSDSLLQTNINIVDHDINVVAADLEEYQEITSLNFLQLDSAYQSRTIAQTDSFTAQIADLDFAFATDNAALAQRTSDIESSLSATGEIGARVFSSETAISTIDQYGTQAHQAMWTVHASAGDATGNFGLIASNDDSGSIFFIDAEHFYVMDSSRNTYPLIVVENGIVKMPDVVVENLAIAGTAVIRDNEAIFDVNRFYIVDTSDDTADPTPVFSIVDGRVVINSLVVDEVIAAKVQALELTAAYVNANVELNAPNIKGGEIEGVLLKGSELGIGTGSFNGYRTHISTSGYFRSENAYIRGNIRASSVNAGIVYTDAIVGNAVSKAITVSTGGRSVAYGGRILIGTITCNFSGSNNATVSFIGSYRANGSGDSHIGMEVYRNGNRIKHSNISLRSGWGSSGAFHHVATNVPNGQKFQVYLINDWTSGTAIKANGSITALIQLK